MANKVTLLLAFCIFFESLVISISEEVYTEQTAAENEAALREVLQNPDPVARDQEWSKVLKAQGTKCAEQSAAKLEQNARASETGAFIWALNDLYFAANDKNTTETIKALNPECPDEKNVTLLVKQAVAMLNGTCQGAMNMATGYNKCMTKKQRAKLPAPKPERKAVFDKALECKQPGEIADEMERVCLEEAGKCSESGKGQLVDNERKPRLIKAIDATVGLMCKVPDCLRQNVTDDPKQAAGIGAFNAETACTQIEGWIELEKQNQ